ncbi:uncharacterized protein PpBr36_06686 [Pyricularia pennisetigena]|uniref:uncharacterized protein n=1 Tax=Pyricularia pennisetigena TaxID=1578925 RepID=UPI00115065DC|nr:uncharacterized protein PpBr36_06686 [Pyricularia pennisetigena]TLS23424.1 hypothetical protein PpBr36_06686 [Pyricularia pennisetigena]
MRVEETKSRRRNLQCATVGTATPIANKENALRSRFPTPQSLEKLHKPFKCPGSATRRPEADRPARKRRKVDYKGADGAEDTGESYTSIERLALANRDVNKYPVFKPKDKETIFRKSFVVPLVNKNVASYNPNRPPPTLGLRQGAVFVAKALHDPSGEFAIVLYDPTVDDKPKEPEKPAEEPDKPSGSQEKLDAPLVHKSLAEILGIKKKVEGEHPRVPVVIDPRLAKVLRPHQIEGVKFMYRCVTGMIDEKANGCIMADEMGLGKTLQCITLLWTLLKQSPEAGKPAIQKAIVACPSSLVRNWANELVKWLGADAITPFAIDGKASKEELTRQLRQWAISSGRAVTRPVIIVSYETLRLNVEELKHTKIGLMLCDEGHRLKNGDSQTFTALNNLNVSRRVILSGTPIQNDLSEYFSLISFANPDLLGTRLEFRKRFELPILRGRDADASEKEREKGDECLKELLALVNKFIIRRTNDILSKYLPVKYEHVVFCNLAPFQLDLYNYFITSPDIQALLRGKGSQPLKAIGILKKLCNHPDLLNLSEDLPGSEVHWPSDYVPKESRGRDRDIKPWYSGKMQVLDRMLARIRADTNDKIVLISNYTSTLDLFERLLHQQLETLAPSQVTMSKRTTSLAGGGSDTKDSTSEKPTYDKQKKLLSADVGHFSLVRALHMADYITALNGLCGIMSIFSSMRYCLGDPSDTTNAYTALAFLPFGLFFDFMDGKVARWRKKTSLMGAQLDSLADLISFGVAPAVVAFAIGMRTPLDHLGLAFYVLCGLTRLARFNVTTDDIPKDATGKAAYFEGTPIPTSLALDGLMAYWVRSGTIHDAIPGGLWLAGTPFEFHPIIAVFILHGCCMTSKTIHIPKP